MNTREAIREGRKLDRKCVGYARETARALGVSYIEAVRLMAKDADLAARGLSMSTLFVAAWCDGEIRRAGLG